MHPILRHRSGAEPPVCKEPTMNDVNLTSAPTAHARRLDRLAEVAVKVGLGLAPGQELIITASLDALPLVRRITEQAYRAGASVVTTIFSDEEATLMRFRHAPDASFDQATGWLFDGMAAAYRAGAARLAIVGENPTLLAGQDPDKVARANRARSQAYMPALELIAGFAINWCLVAAATPAWAKAVFPGEPAEVAVQRLWDAIFAASRIDGDDPVAAWTAHNAALRARTDFLNKRRYAALRYRGPNTDLSIGLADEHEWCGGASQAKNGIICNANIPTEEVFTTPHKDRVDGVVASTKPLSYMGTLIEDIRVRSARWRWCLTRRRSRRAACCSTTRCSTRMPRAILRWASPTANASSTARRSRPTSCARGERMPASSISTG
jgi:aminopeptidase